MDKNLILKKRKEKKIMNKNIDSNMDTISNSYEKNKIINIYIYNNNLINLCDSINQFSNFSCSIFTDDIKINNNDFIIYPEDIIDNPLGFKNVIRIIQSKSFSIYPPTDILLFYSETESLISISCGA